MNDYKKLYFNLFNEISDTIESLVAAQRKAEESFMQFSSEENTVMLSDSEIGESYGKILNLLKEEKYVVVSNKDGVEFVVIAKEEFGKLD